jgi:hypothetical protein
VRPADARHGPATGSFGEHRPGDDYAAATSWTSILERTITVPTDDPDRLTATLKRHFTPENLDRVRQLLTT